MIDETKRTVDERLAVARHSSDLTLKKYRCDADALIAAGLAALRANPGAASLVRLRFAMDASEWGAALSRATQIAMARADRENWRLEDPQIRALAKIALRHFLVPTCPSCFGQKFETVTGTGRLGTRLCQTCRGTGERPLPKDSARFLRAILARLEDDSQRVTSLLRGVMR